MSLVLLVSKLRSVRLEHRSPEKSIDVALTGGNNAQVADFFGRLVVSSKAFLFKDFGAFRFQ